MIKIFFADIENYNILNYLKIDYNGTEIVLFIYFYFFKTKNFYFNINVLFCRRGRQNSNFAIFIFTSLYSLF